ncbi:DUF3300 domain-containing protein [Geomesophilobacter sediminis]|uniref:DUF3300 domain-containing protein n=1 Tax=Geomesophilobacter sediminis TaxID=2798584 RepID=A0A8J7SA31_9BACT|nr:DUF3300 domain-containing protein [Geomesophilobacter sediminis]MBJ6727240.1 DUF3300 domain-containing protein [Geomesophilobacter sediminis]
MKRLLYVVPLFLIIVCAWSVPRCLGQTETLLTPDELDQLAGPIALYPDPLLAQILPAATFVDQVEQAADYVARYGTAGVDAQPWDLSVRAIAHYPQIVEQLDDQPEWTTALGQAYLNQPRELMEAIQRLRAEAYAEGNLASNPEQQVIDAADGIRIVPAVPQYIYVPIYDPELVYLEPPQPGIAFVSFGTPLLIGVWLNRDCDWHRRRVFYHGWRGGGWIARSRPHIGDRGHIYVGKNASVVRVNRNIRTRDTHDFRRELRNDALRQRELRGRAHRPGAAPTPAPERRREGMQRGAATGSAVGAPTTPTARRGRSRDRSAAPAAGAAPAATKPSRAAPAPAPGRAPLDAYRRRGAPAGSASQGAGTASGRAAGSELRGGEHHRAPAATAPAPARRPPHPALAAPPAPPARHPAAAPGPRPLPAPARSFTPPVSVAPRTPAPVRVPAPARPAAAPPAVRAAPAAPAPHPAPSGGGRGPGGDEPFRH